jgi:hypothetical protein
MLCDLMCQAVIVETITLPILNSHISNAGNYSFLCLAFPTIYNNFHLFFIFIYCFLTIYSRYLKRVISKGDGCVYLKQVPSIDGSLELI